MEPKEDRIFKPGVLMMKINPGDMKEYFEAIGKADQIFMDASKGDKDRYITMISLYLDALKDQKGFIIVGSSKDMVITKKKGDSDE